jgi:CheY-like chemotaxis protein
MLKGNNFRKRDELNGAISHIGPDVLLQEHPRVFVVEDDLELITVIDKVLKSIDPEIQIDWATSAEEAVFKLRQKTSGGGSKPYHLIIADIFLEGDATGLDLWNLCQQTYPEIPLVVTSGLSVEKFISTLGRDTICPPFLQKPFALGECRQMFQGLLQYGTSKAS